MAEGGESRALSALGSPASCREPGSPGQCAPGKQQPPGHGCELARAPLDLCSCGSWAGGLKTGVESRAVFFRGLEEEKMEQLQG